MKSNSDLERFVDKFRYPIVEGTQYVAIIYDFQPAFLQSIDFKLGRAVIILEYQKLELDVNLSSVYLVSATNVFAIPIGEYLELSQSILDIHKQLKHPVTSMNMLYHTIDFKIIKREQIEALALLRPYYYTNYRNIKKLENTYLSQYYYRLLTDIAAKTILKATKDAIGKLISEISATYLRGDFIDKYIIKLLDKWESVVSMPDVIKSKSIDIRRTINVILYTKLENNLSKTSMMMLFKLQVLPLFMYAEAQIVQLKLVGIMNLTETYNLVKLFTEEMWIERCTILSTSFASIVSERSTSENVLEEIYDQYKFLSVTKKHYGFMLKMYVPNIIVKKYLDEESLYEILQKLTHYKNSIIMHNFIFSYLNSLYITGFDYERFVEVQNIRSTSLLDEKSEIVAIQKRIDSEFFINFASYTQSQNLCSKIDIKLLESYFTDSDSNIEHLITALTNTLCFYEYEWYFRELLKKDAIYMNIKNGGKYYYPAKIKSPYDLGSLKLLTLEYNNYVLNFSNILVVLDVVRAKMKYIYELVSHYFSVLKLPLNCDELLNGFLLAGKKLLYKMGYTVKLDLAKFSNEAADEIQQLRYFMQSCLSTPYLITTGMQIKEKILQFIHSRYLVYDEIFIENARNFIHTFSENYEERYIQAHYSALAKPVGTLYYLLIDIVKTNYNISSEKQYFANMLHSIDIWVLCIMRHCEEIFQKLMTLTFDDIYLSFNNPLDFVNKFPIFLREPPFGYVTLNVEKKLYIPFLYSIAKSTLLQVFSTEVSNKEILYYFAKSKIIDRNSVVTSSKSILAIPLKIFKRENKFELINLIQELKFLLMEFSTIYLILIDWRKWILDDINDNNIKVLFMENHASSSSILLALSPVAEIIVGMYKLYKVLDIDKDLPLYYFPDEICMYIIEKIIFSVKTFKERSYAGDYYISSIRNDYNKIGQLFKNPEEKKYFKGDIGLVSFSINYASWETYISNCSTYILPYIDTFSTIYIIKNKSFGPQHLTAISYYLSCTIEQNHSVKSELVINTINKSEKTLLLNFLLLMRYNAELDTKAMDCLKNLYSMLSNIVIFEVFDTKLSNDNLLIKFVDKYSLQDFYGFIADVKVNFSKLRQIITTPLHVDYIFSEALYKIALIIYNVGFLNNRKIEYVKYYDKHFDFIAQNLRYNLNNSFLPYYLKEYEELIMYWRCNKNVEYYARDLEAMIQIMKMIQIVLKKLPIMIKDLVTMYLETNVVIYRSPVVSFDINYFNYKYEKMLVSCFYYWSYIVENYLNDVYPVKYVDLALDEYFLKQLTFTYEKTNDLFYDVQTNYLENIIKTLKAEEIMNSHFILSNTYKVSMMIIPSRFLMNGNVEYYPSSLLINMPNYIKYHEYPSDNNIFDITRFSSSFMFAISAIKIAYRKGKWNFHSVVSKSEVIEIQQIFEVPHRNLEVLDKLFPILKYYILANAFRQWDKFILAISRRNNVVKTEITTTWPTGHVYLKRAVLTSEQSDLSNSKSIQNEYFDDLLIDFVNSCSYQAFCLVISTYFMQSFDKVKTDALKFNFDVKMMTQYIKLFGSLNLALAKSSKSDIYKAAAKSRLSEFSQVFGELKRLAIRSDFYKRYYDIPNLAFSYLNYHTNQIEVTDLHYSFSIYSGCHWYGEAKDSEVGYISYTKRNSMIYILQGLSERNAVFVVGSKAKGYNNKEFYHSVYIISRYLMMNVKIIYLSQSKFAEKLQEIEISLICGMLCVVYGVEFLESNYLFELINLYFKLHNYCGSYKTVCTTKKVSHDVGKAQVSLYNVYIYDFVNLGHIIYFSPYVENIEAATHTYQHNSEKTKRIFMDKPKEVLETEQKNKVNNVTFSYKAESYLSELICQIAKYFENGIIANIDTISTSQDYLNSISNFGYSFYELNYFLLRFDHQHCTIPVDVATVIMYKVKDNTNSYYASLLTMETIMKYSLFLINDDLENETMCYVIANIIAASFGLDLTRANYLFNASKYLWTQLETNLYKANFKRKHLANIKAKMHYDKFFVDFMYEHYNDIYLDNMRKYYYIHYLSMIMVSDLFYCNDILNSGYPLLLLTTSYYHLKIFSNYLSCLRYQKIIFITTALEYLSALKETQYSLVDNYKFLFLISPSSYYAYYEMSENLLQMFTYKNIYNSFIISLNLLLYEQVKTNYFTLMFKQRYLINPSYEGSLINKRLFFGNLNINAYEYVYASENRLINLWIGKEAYYQQYNNAFKMIENIYSAYMICSAKHNDEYYLIEKKALALYSYLFGLISVIYDILSKIFNIGNSFEEVIIWRSLTLLFLYKLNILSVSKTLDISIQKTENVEFNPYYMFYYENSSIIKSILFDFMVSKQYNIDDMHLKHLSCLLSEEREELRSRHHSSIDLAFYSCEYINYTDELFLKYAKFEPNLEKALFYFHQYYVLQKSIEKGFGCSYSLKFYFDDNYIFDAFFETKVFSDAFVNISVPIITAMWNATSLYYYVVRCSNKWKDFENGNILYELNKRYTKFINEFESTENFKNQVLAAFNLFIIATADGSKYFSNFNPACMQYYSIKYNKYFINNHNLTTYYQSYILRHYFELIAAYLPNTSQLCKYNFMYISSMGKMMRKKDPLFVDYYFISTKFVNYQLGSGVFSYLVYEYDYELLEKNISFVTTRYINQRLYNKPELDTNELLSEFDYPTKLSIQKLETSGLFIDSHRAAIIFLLSASLMSPITTAIYGQYKMGKSILIKIAYLSMRDLIDANYIPLYKSESKFSDISIRYAFASVGYLKIVNYDSYLNNYQYIAFPSYHIHASQSESKYISENIVLLLRDHYVKFNGKNDIYLECNYDTTVGTVVMYDSSFIIECNYYSPFLYLAGIQVYVPPIYADFFASMLQKKFKNQNKEYIYQFVDGYFILKANMTSEYLHSFEIITHFTKLRFLTVNDTSIIEEIVSNDYISMSNSKDCDIHKILNYYSEAAYIKYDSHLTDLSITALSYICLQYLEEKSIDIIAEKLPTLVALKYLYLDKANSPWVGYEYAMKYESYVLPLWYTQTINAYYEYNAKPAVDIKYVANYYQILTIIDKNIKSSLLKHVPKYYDADYLISLGFFGQTTSIFNYYIYTYKRQLKHIDPFLANHIFEAFLLMETQKEINISKLTTFIKYGLTRKNHASLTGINAEDENLPSRYFITNQVSKYSALIYDKIIEKKKPEFYVLLNQDNELLYLEKETILDSHVADFGGFSLSSTFSLCVPKYYVKLEYYSEKGYEEFSYLYYFLSNFDSAHEKPIKLFLPLSYDAKSSKQSNVASSHTSYSHAYSMRSQLSSKFGGNDPTKKNCKILIDINYILSYVEKYNSIPSKYKYVEVDNQFDIVKYLVNTLTAIRVKTSQSYYDYDFLLVFMIFRIAVCLCLGVRPQLVFDEKLNDYFSYLGFQLSSKLYTNYPSKVISSGRFLAYLPKKCASIESIKYRITGSSKYSNHSISSLICMPMEVTVICTEDLYHLMCPTGVSMYELVNAMTESNSVLTSLFTYEEYYCLIYLTCSNFNIETVLNPKLMTSILSTNLSLLMFGFEYCTNYRMNFGTVGVVRHPLSYFKSELSKKVMKFYFRYSSNLTDKHFANIKSIFYIEYFRKMYTKHYRFNTNYVSNSVFDIERSTNLSSFPLLKKYDFYNVFHLNKQDQIILYTIPFALYKYVKRLSTSPIPSFEQFLNAICTMYSMYLEKIKFFIDTYTKNYTFLDFYSKLVYKLSPTPYNLDVLLVDNDYIKLIVSYIQVKAEINMKLDGTLLTKDQQKIYFGIGEAIMLRDYFYSIDYYLTKQKERIKYKITNILLISICCAAFTMFFINGTLDKYYLIFLLYNAEFGSMDVGLKFIQYKIIYNDGDYDPFNFLVAAIFYYNGIIVQYPKEMNKYNNPEEIYLCYFTENYGDEMFLNNYVELLAEDSTIFILARFFKLDWQKGDPYICCLNSVRIYYSIGYTNFAVSTDIAMVTAYLIATKSVTVYYHTIKTVELRDDEDDLYCNKLIENHKKQIFFIEMTWKTTYQMYILKQALYHDNPIIVLNNFGCTNYNVYFFEIMKKFIYLKCDKSTETLYYFRLGVLVFTSKLPIKSINIIIGACNEVDFYEYCYGYGSENYKIIDKIAVFLIPIKSMKYNNVWILESTKQYVIKSIFGTQQTKRARTELIKLYEIYYMQIFSLINKIFDRLKVVIQYKLPITYLEINSFCVKNTIFGSTFEAMYNYMFYSFKKIVISYTTYILISQKELLDDENMNHYLNCYNFQIVSKIHEYLIEPIANSIFYIFLLFKRLRETHLPSTAACDEDSLRKICYLINSLSKSTVQQLSEYHSEKSYNYVQNSFYYAYPLTYYIYYNLNEFKRKIMKIVIEFFSIRSIKLFSSDYAHALMLIAKTIVLTLTSHSNIESSEDFRTMTCNYQDLYIVPRLLTENMNDYINILTMYQIVTSFYPSALSIDKVYSTTDYDSYKTIGYLTQVYPEICEISSKLYYYWLNLYLFSRYNKQVMYAMAWYIKNNASFVYMAYVDSIFLSALRGIKKKNEHALILSKTEKNTAWLYDYLFSSKFYNKIQSLPPYFNKLDLGTSFLLFVQSIAIEPEKLMENIHIYGSINYSLNDMTYEYLIEIYETNAYYNIDGGIFDEKVKITVEYVATMIYYSYKEGISLFTNMEINIYKEMVSDVLYYLFIVCRYAALLKQYHEYNLSKSHLIVTLIFYDSAISIIYLINYVFSYISKDDKKYLNRIEFYRNIKFEDLTNHTVALFVDPLLTGDSILMQLENIINMKAGGMYDEKIHPVFVLLPSCVVSPSMNYSLYYGAITIDSQTFTNFVYQLSKMLYSCNPSYIYIKLPNSPAKAFTHVFSVVMSTIQYQKPSKWFSNKRIVTLRGLVMFVLKYASMMISETVDYSDTFIYGTITYIVTKMKYITYNSLLIKDNPPIGVYNMNDMYLLNTIEFAYDYIAVAGQSRIKLLFDQMNLNIQADMADTLFYYQSVSVAKERTIDEYVYMKLHGDDESTSDEVVSDGMEDIDDSYSFSSSVSTETTSSTDVSSSTKTLTYSSSLMNDKTMKRFRKITLNVFEDVQVKLNALSCPHINKLDEYELRTNVQRVVYAETRKLRHVSVPIPEAFKYYSIENWRYLYEGEDKTLLKASIMRLGRVNAFQYVQNFLYRLYALADGFKTDSYSKFLPIYRALLRYSVGISSTEQKIRSMFSCDAVRQTLQQIVAQKQTKVYDLSEPNLENYVKYMPDALSCFSKMLKRGTLYFSFNRRGDIWEHAWGHIPDPEGDARAQVWVADPQPARGADGDQVRAPGAADEGRDPDPDGVDEPLQRGGDEPAPLRDDLRRRPEHRGGLHHRVPAGLQLPHQPLRERLHPGLRDGGLPPRNGREQDPRPRERDVRPRPDEDRRPLQAARAPGKQDPAELRLLQGQEPVLRREADLM